MQDQLTLATCPRCGRLVWTAEVDGIKCAVAPDRLDGTGVVQCLLGGLWVYRVVDDAQGRPARLVRAGTDFLRAAAAPTGSAADVAYLVTDHGGVPRPDGLRDCGAPARDMIPIPLIEAATAPACPTPTAEPHPPTSGGAPVATAEPATLPRSEEGRIGLTSGSASPRCPWCGAPLGEVIEDLNDLLLWAAHLDRCTAP